jgi:transcription initiation factor TFIID subunit 12
MAQHPSAGTPTQPTSARIQTPQSATPGQANAQPLSMSAAVTLANQRAGQPGVGGPMSIAIPNAGGGAPLTPAPPSANVAIPPPAMHTHAHPVAVQMPSAQPQSKMPIPKQLPEKAVQPPQAVAMAGGAGPGRPTYNGGTGTAGGVMGQPAVAKVPAYVTESESEHVLSKRKLDELVRQVCGGTAEGQEENLIAPEVEEVCYCPPDFPSGAKTMEL